MRPWLLALALAAVSCRGDLLDARRQVAIEIAAAAPDPVALSAAARRAARRGCGGLLAAVDALGAAGLPARATEALIGEAVAARTRACPRDAAVRALAGDTAARAVARSYLVSGEPALAALDGAADVAPVRLRRAAVLAHLGRRDDAVAELRAALAEADEPAVRAELVRALEASGSAEAASRAAAGLGETNRGLRVEALAAAGRAAEVAAIVAAAPLPERLELARRAVSAASGSALAELAARPQAPAELVWAAASRIAELAGPAAALPHLERAAAALPRDADVLAALGAARAAAGDVDGALDAWDRARRLAPAVPSLSIDPVAALARAGRDDEARRRAAEVAAAARGADELDVAGAAAEAAGDHRAAERLSARALEARPGDGRLVFTHARRLARAGRPAEALGELTRLLVCGAHGRPWHRHEVAAAIVEVARAAGLGAAARRQLERHRDCPAAGPATLQSYVVSIGDKLAEPDRAGASSASATRR